MLYKCVTIDNASANSVAIAYYLEAWVYGLNQAKDMLKILKDIIHKMSEYYSVIYPLLDGSSSGSFNSSIASHDHVIGSENANEEEGGFKDKYRLKVKKKLREVKRNELERYMEDDVEDNISDFDILRWWKLKSMKYYALAYMARDLMAIPVSIVSSESAFSTSGRMLNQFRSSLSPSTVESLICSQNWLRNPEKMNDLNKEIED
nr:zinc finger BED domain-containing protein RICESLEEPER 1-like [Arachis hypogaea]